MRTPRGTPTLRHSPQAKAKLGLSGRSTISIPSWRVTVRPARAILRIAPSGGAAMPVVELDAAHWNTTDDFPRDRRPFCSLRHSKESPAEICVFSRSRPAWKSHRNTLKTFVSRPGYSPTGASLPPRRLRPIEVADRIALRGAALNPLASPETEASKRRLQTHCSRGERRGAWSGARSAPASKVTMFAQSGAYAIEIVGAGIDIACALSALRTGPGSQTPAGKARRCPVGWPWA